MAATGSGLRGEVREGAGGGRLLAFLKYGAHANPGEPRVPFYRHTLPVRLMHWINAIVLLVMLMSGLQIFNAHPALYWGQQSRFRPPGAVAHRGAEAPDGNREGVTQIGP